MSGDVLIVISKVKSTLLEIAKNTETLGTGLQNVAPAEKLGSRNTSINYLMEISKHLKQVSVDVENLSAHISQQASISNKLK